MACLTPGAFLPAIEGTDLMELLGETMLTQSLAALAESGTAGGLTRAVGRGQLLGRGVARSANCPIACAGHSTASGWRPSRLTVEVLESVVAGDGDDIIARNIRRIADMGCGVDLDDFGTGNASITSIRRFALRRLKIDRSFVREVDQNRDQQKLVTAILSLAERLGLETLAEGVETPGRTRDAGATGLRSCAGLSSSPDRCRPKTWRPGWPQHRETLRIRPFGCGVNATGA